ncbi:putative transferase CAF17, mitochondrial isoform 2-T2 [Leptodactylus fuscus]|uniref:iron-sulfur cluster assembly factor IBA57, mitochondrial isoform X2 n=1 Tax=Leptodactylus fuscus TaxID=238119 RepID=UPI003F4ECFEC
MRHCLQSMLYSRSAPRYYPTGSVHAALLTVYVVQSECFLGTILQGPYMRHCLQSMLYSRSAPRYYPTGVPEPQGGSHDLLLECDITAMNAIQQHLQVYNFRKKIELRPCPELSIWAVIQEKPDPPVVTPTPPALLCAPDPRGPVMGYRLVAQTGQDIREILSGAKLGNVRDYSRHRYQHGIPEGVKDLPPGEALPLESNLVYMNGVSFSKGCYIGQELTARTHHTGIIRKRLVPVRLSSSLSADCAGMEITTASGKSAGKFRAGVEELGLALLRLAHMKEELRITPGGGAVISVEASVPGWWPSPGDGV